MREKSPTDQSVQPGSCLCCRRLLLLLLVLPGARSHSGATEETSGLPSSPVDSSRILMKLTDRPPRRQPVDFKSFSVVCKRQESLAEAALLLLPLSCPPLPCTCLCLARCCAPTLKSRRNPGRRSAAGTPESHGPGEEGRRKSVVTSGTDSGR